MEKTIRVVDEKASVVQITTLDERWYAFPGKDVAGLPTFEFYPSITWIASYYPKGIGYMKWLAEHGWDEAEALKTEAGDRGTIIHHACEHLILEKSVKMDQKFKGKDGVERALTPNEYYHVITFAQWYESVGKPPLYRINDAELAVEKTVRGDGYACTYDFIFVIDGEYHIKDLKTGGIWPSAEVQLTGLKPAVEKAYGITVASLSCIQTGYTRNKTLHYKETFIDYQPEILDAAKKIWAKENPKTKPFQRDYPMEVTI